MRILFKLYHYLNILSLDIAAGAVVSAMFFAKIFQVHVRSYGFVALALTVWIIYTADHLRDSKKIKHSASTQRHLFHQRHFHQLLVWLCLAILLDFITIYFIRRQVFEWGLIVFMVVIFYLLIQRSLKFFKELFIAALYTAGILLLSLTTTTVELDLVHFLLIIQFGCIAWINLLLFSWFDHVVDKYDEQPSFVTILGSRTTAYLLSGLFVTSLFIMTIYIMLKGPVRPIFVLIIMTMTLLLIFAFKKFFSKHDLYRLVGDAVFFFPVLFLIE